MAKRQTISLFSVNSTTKCLVGKKRSPTQLHPLHHHSSPMIEETKFILSGRFERPNGHIMRNELAFISASKEEAIATCQRLYPYFHVHTVTEDHSKPEVVKLQPLR